MYVVVKQAIVCQRQFGTKLFTKSLFVTGWSGTYVDDCNGRCTCTCVYTYNTCTFTCMAYMYY